MIGALIGLAGGALFVVWYTTAAKPMPDEDPAKADLMWHKAIAFYFIISALATGLVCLFAAFGSLAWPGYGIAIVVIALGAFLARQDAKREVRQSQKLGG